MAIERVMQEVKIETRKVQQSKVPDINRGGKVFLCSYIRVNNNEYTLPFYGWKTALKVKHDNSHGDYVVIDGVNYYLRYK